MHYIIRAMSRIKLRPEDFYVKELKSLSLKQRGRYAYFLLWKRDMTTYEAVGRVACELGVPVEKVGFAGLKDKRAVTEQFISIEGLKRVKEIAEENLKVRFLGWGDEPVRLGDIEGNYFEIRLEGVGDRKRDYMKRKVEFVERFGFENYFGEQRFGSVKHARDFVVRHLLRNDYEGALKEYLTSMKDLRRRRALLKAWGRWKGFLELMPQSSEVERSVVKLLMKGKSFEEAYESIPRSLKLMFSFAYQSYLWNRYLNTFVVRYFKHCSVPFLRWRLSFTTRMDERVFEEIRDLEIPFTGREFKPKSTKVKLIVEEVMREEGLGDKELKAKRGGVRLFSDGVRRAFVFPKDLRVLEEGKNHVRISFTLPPGSYATILLRKLLCSNVDSLR